MSCRHGNRPNRCRICLLELQVESQKEEIQGLKSFESVSNEAVTHLNELVVELRHDNKAMHYCLDNIANRPIGVFGDGFGYDFHYKNLRESAKKCLEFVAKPLAEQISEIIHKKRIVGNFKDEQCPECKTIFQTGTQNELNLPYCGACGKIVLDALQNYCCWCGCRYKQEVQPHE